MGTLGRPEHDDGRTGFQVTIEGLLAVLLGISAASLVVVPLSRPMKDSRPQRVPSVVDEAWIDQWLDDHCCGECGSPRDLRDRMCGQCGAPLRPGEGMS